MKFLVIFSKVWRRINLIYSRFIYIIWYLYHYFFSFIYKLKLIIIFFIHLFIFIYFQIYFWIHSFINRFINQFYCSSSVLVVSLCKSLFLFELWLWNLLNMLLLWLLYIKLEEFNLCQSLLLTEIEIWSFILYKAAPIQNWSEIHLKFEILCKTSDFFTFSNFCLLEELTILNWTTVTSIQCGTPTYLWI